MIVPGRTFATGKGGRGAGGKKEVECVIQRTDMESREVLTFITGKWWGRERKEWNGFMCGLEE